MSGIASFIKLPTSSLTKPGNAAVPKKSWFGGSRDNYHEFLRTNGREVVEYHWSGWVFGTLLSYLEERHHIDLMKSEYEPLAKALTSARGGSHFIFSSDLKTKYFGPLDSLTVSEEELRDYYNEFNETSEPEAGKPMLDGVKALRDALAHVDDSSVVLFAIL